VEQGRGAETLPESALKLIGAHTCMNGIRFQGQEQKTWETAKAQSPVSTPAVSAA